MICPFTDTFPVLTISAASRREAMPACARNLFSGIVLPPAGGGVAGVETGFEAPAVFPAGIDREAFDEEAFALPGFEGLSSDRIDEDLAAGWEMFDLETLDPAGFEGLAVNWTEEEGLRAGWESLDCEALRTGGFEGLSPDRVDEDLAPDRTNEERGDSCEETPGLRRVDFF